MTKTQSTLRSILATLCMLVVSTSALAAIDFSGVRALANRMGGTALTSKVTFTEWEGQSGDKAQIIPNGATFTIKATSVHAASLALGTYLRDVAKGHISWCGKRMPTEWPIPTATIDVAPRYPHAMAYNYCTLSYTMAYWSKEAWQNEIDRLALSGYTTALCMAGVQRIWQLTMEELGYTKQQQQDFIVDDAQQAWWLMGNLQAIGNGTPQGHYPVVSDEEIDADAEIGKFIVKQMRAVGIEPVLQGFIGLVPSTTTKDQLVSFLNSHPDVCTKYGITDTSAAVKIFVTGSYNEGHKSPDLVDPNCTMFQVFSDVWNKNLKAAYGMEDEKDYPKFLGGDLFHENSPPSSMTETEKNNCAKFVQKYQQDAFPGVTWVLQNWQSAPVQDLRNGLDPEHTIIQRLDQSMNATDARTASYTNNKMSPVGKIPWVWVEVMNFGGNTGMHGAFRRFRNVGNLGGNDSFKGYGLLSEGLETNPISYDMYHWAMAKTTQAEQNIDDDELEPWMEAYRLRRYGYTDDKLKAAYTILANTVWTCKQDQQGTVESVFCAKPAYSVAKVSAWGPTTGTPYDRVELITAAEHILAAAKENHDLLQLETFRYDFVEIFQQILADKAREILPDCASSQKRRTEFRRMLELLDSILACSNEWRLDAKEARLVGKAPTTGPAAYRRLITTWTPPQRHQTQLSQYAHRSYAGLVKNYYAKKWNAFFDVTEGTMSLAAYNTFCDTLDEEFSTMDLTAEDKKTPSVDSLDPVAIAEEILETLNPPAFSGLGLQGTVSWNKTDEIWTNANGRTVAWEDEFDVNIGGVATITASEAVTTGAFTLQGSGVTDPAIYTGYIPVGEGNAVKLYENISESHIDYVGFTATMDGKWVARKEAKSYRLTRGHEYTSMQFQVLDDGYLKAVEVRTYRKPDDDSVWGYAVGAGNISGGSYGQYVTVNPATCAQADTADGYGVFGLKTVMASELTLEGPITISGELTVGEGTLTLTSSEQISSVPKITLENGTLVLPDGVTATIPSVVVADETAAIKLNGAANLTINALSVFSGAQLTITGPEQVPAIKLVSVDGKVIKPSWGTVFYNGKVMTADTDGNLVSALQAHSLESYVTTSYTDTGWTDITLDDLMKYQFTGLMKGSWMGSRSPAVHGYFISKNADGTVSLQMQCLDENIWLKSNHLTFKEDGGKIYVKSDWAHNKYNTTKIPEDITGSSYSKNIPSDSTGYGIYELTLTPATARVNEIDSNYTDFNAAVPAANNTDSKAVTVYDDVAYKGNEEISLALTVEAGSSVSLGSSTWTFGTDRALTLGDGSGVMGSVIFAEGTVVDVTGSALIDSVFSDNASVTKRGTGSLSLILVEGSTVTITVEEGTVNVVAPDENHKIEINDNTYSCVEKHYVYRVTVPGAISVNLDGVNYETFEEALAAAITSQAANSQKEVKLWVLSQEDSDKVTEFLEEYNATHGTSYDLFGNGDGIAVINWNDHIPGQKAHFDAVLAIVGRLAGGYNEESVELGADTTAADAAMAKFEFVRDADLGQSAKVGPGTDGKIRITAANAAGASFGLGQYLRNDAKVHISWCGNHVSDYTTWPVPASEKTYTPSAQLRMAYNYCTISYTMAFWNQRQWREELDRLALNGFNGALVMHGLGKVWKETLTDMGYTADEIRKFIPDAATWAWWNMGNIEGIGGPVSDAQLEQDAAMAKWMYGAMKEIGIEPLLQAFVGLVPSTSQRAMTAMYPSNSSGSHYILLGQGAYQGLTRPYVLHGANVSSSATGDDYSLPAFDDFAAAWYTHLAEVYDFTTAGKPLYLGGDLFHEGGSTSGVNVTRYAKKIQSVQQRYYPGVKWILQHWGTNPSQAFVNNLDADHTIIERLDLDMNGSGASNSGWTNSSGKKFPWIWCEVMNFGGNTGMYGGVTRYRNLTKIGVGDSTFLGWGLLSEGLETNPMVYDIMMEQMHQPSNDAMDDNEFATFMDNYLVRRYGQKDTAVRAAIQTLSETVLKTKRSQQGVLESVLCANPKKCPVTQVSSWGPSGAIEYDRTELYSVAEAYLEAARSASYKDIETFKYDFAELFLQLISDRAREINGLTLTSKSARNEFRKLIDLAERLLASSERWRLDWHEDRTAGAADEAAAVRGYRRMVTTWVEHNNRGTGSLPEYAHRAYAGLIKDYYGKRWNLFFDKTEGTISESDYTAAINTLDSTFPTAKLTATAAGDLVAIGEEIMETLIPPAYAWTGAGNDGNWATAANWSFKEQPTAYENGYDVTLPADGSTITASAPVTTGAITLGSASQDLAGLSAMKTYNTAFIPATAGSIGWTGVTLADLLNGRYTGVMGGGWMGSNKNLACVGYFPTLSADGQTVTVQFHGLLDNYTRCVAVEFTIVDGEVHAKAAWVKNASGDVCGVKNFKSTDANGTRDTPTVATSDSTGAYGLKAISLYPSTTLTLAGPITVGGALTIQAQEALSFTGTEPTTLPEVVFANGGSLSAANVTTIESLSVEASGGILELADAQDLEIKSLTTAAGTKLVLKASVESLMGESGLPRVKAPREALSSLIFIGSDGEEKALLRDASGYLKCAIGTLTYDAFVTATATKTTWKNVTLDDLAACEFTACMTGGYFGNKEGGVVVSYRHVASRGAIITKTASSLTLQMQCVDDGWLKVVPLTFTIGADGFVYVQAATGGAKSGGKFGESVTGTTPLATAETEDGYGVHELVVKPAVATVPAIKANYSSLDDAITAAKAQTDKNVSVIADTTYGTSRGLTGSVILTIEPDVKLTSTTGDGTDWGGTSEVVVKGELDLAKTRWTFSSNNTLTLYTGATVKGAGDGKNGACAVEIHGNEHTIAVHKGDGETAVISSTIGLSNSVIFDVDAEAKLEIGNTSGGNNGAAARTITKNGSGELAIVGSVYANATVILNAGTLTRKLAPEATFTMTVNGGTPNILPTDEEDYEINDDEGENNVHTYTSTAIPWVFYVTPAGATTDAAAGGVKCRTLEEALAKRAEWGPTAKIWVIRGVDTTLPDGYELNDGSAGSEVIVPKPRVYNLTAFGINWWDTDDTGSVYVGPATKGGDAKWDVAANWMKTTKDGVGDRRTGGANDYAPYALGNPYNYALIDGDNIDNVTPDGEGVYHLTADKLDFWRVRLGLTNKVDVTITEVTKMQKGASAFIYVDPTSKLTIKKVTSNKGETIDLHSAAPEGIVFEGMNGNVWNFYLEGEGTVQFDCQLSGSSHTVKYAEVDLGTGDGKYVKSKKLVGFTSLASGANVTLADDAVITAADGTTMKSGEVSDTAEVGTCAIREGADGFYLDFVARRSLYNEWRPIEDNNWTTAANWSWGAVPELNSTMVKIIGGEEEAVNLVCLSTGTTHVNELRMEGVIRLSGKLDVGNLVSADELRIASDGEVYFVSNYVGISGTAKIVFEDTNSKLTNYGWPEIGGTVTVVVEEGVTATFFSAGTLCGSANGKVIKQGFGTLKFGMEFGRASRSSEKDWLKNLEIQEGIVEINAGCVENVYGDGKLKATTAKATNLTVKSLQAIMMVDMGTHTDGTTTLSTITMGDGADLDLTCSDKCCLTYEINGDKHPVVSSGAWGFLGTVSGDTGTWDYSAVTIGDSDLKTSATTKTRTIGNQGFKYTLGTRHDEVKISIVVDLKADNQGKMLISVGYAQNAGAPSNFANLMYTATGTLKLTYAQTSTVGSTGETAEISGKHLVTMVCSATKGTKLLVDGVEVASDTGIMWTSHAPCGIIRFGSWADSGVQGTEKATWYHATGTRYYSACIDCAGESGTASAAADFRLPAAFSKVTELEKAKLTLEYLNGDNGRVEVPGAYSIEGCKVITDIAKIEEMEEMLGKNTGSKVTDLSMPFVPAEQTDDADSVSIAVDLSADLKGGKLVLVTSTTPNGEMTEVEGQVKTTPKAGTQTFTLDSITESMSTGKVLYFKVKAEPNK